MEVAIILWILSGIVTSVVASNRGRSGCNWLLVGFVLGPLGLIFVLVMVPGEEQVPSQDQQPVATSQSELSKQCPYCAESLQAQAIVCRYCVRHLSESSKSHPRRDVGAAEVDYLYPSSTNESDSEKTTSSPMNYRKASARVVAPRSPTSSPQAVIPWHIYKKGIKKAAE